MSHTAPPEVDARGNINPHYQEGIKIPVRDADVNSVPIDISAKNWYFRTAGGLDIQLTPDPDNAAGLLLVLTKDDVGTLPLEGEAFVVVDTDADPDDVRWEGRITPRGWK